MIDEQGLYRQVGERLRALREQRRGVRGRLTQGELASQVRLERTSITNMEKGVQKVPLHVLFRISEALGVAVADLLPTVTEVQSAADTVATEEITIGERVEMVPPLVKQAIESVLRHDK
ncbi:helix-turn-helix domain-containing protein [Ralstonia pseudosolanacearum]